MKKYCILRDLSMPRVREWPDEPREMYRSMDKAGKLEGYTSKEAAEKAIPPCLRGYCRVGEYMILNI